MVMATLDMIMLCQIAEKGPTWRKLQQQGNIKERESVLPCKATAESQVLNYLYIE